MHEPWKLSFEEKAELLEEAARWKASAAALSEDASKWRASSWEWEKEAMKQARENEVLRKLLRQRLQMIIEAMPEIA